MTRNFSGGRRRTSLVATYKRKLDAAADEFDKSEREAMRRKFDLMDATEAADASTAEQQDGEQGAA